MEICFASNNQNKMKEIRLALGSALSVLSLHDIGCNEELPETRDSLEGNALQKAEYVWEHYRKPCFADDTGLEVDALGGAPGVYSARYAGPARSSDSNMALLLQNLQGVHNRRARFRTVIALVGVDPKPVLFEGAIEGNIISERRGSGGFGYDPVFVPLGHTKTFAEMTLAEKNTMSHRAIAVQRLSAYLKGKQ